MTVEEMARLHAACFVRPRPWSGADIIETLAAPAAFVRAEPGGFAIGRVAADEAELLTLAVDPTMRRRGIGRRLLGRIEGEAAARGARRLFLEVAADNHAAIALYRAAGYGDIGRRPAYYVAAGEAVDALVLSRELEPQGIQG